jgi:hypothetical protein
VGFIATEHLWVRFGLALGWLGPTPSFKSYHKYFRIIAKYMGGREGFFETSNKCYQYMSFGMQTLTPTFKTIYPITCYHMSQSMSKPHPNQCQKHTPTISKAHPSQRQSTP